MSSPSLQNCPKIIVDDNVNNSMILEAGISLKNKVGKPLVAIDSFELNLVEAQSEDDLPIKQSDSAPDCSGGAECLQTGDGESVGGRGRGGELPPLQPLLDRHGGGRGESGLYYTETVPQDPPHTPQSNHLGEPPG